MHSESRIKPFRRGLAPKMILILCVAGLLVLAIIFLGTSMNRKPPAVSPAITPVPAPCPGLRSLRRLRPPAAVDEASLEPATGSGDARAIRLRTHEAPGSVTSRTDRSIEKCRIETNSEVLGSKKTCSCTMVDVTPAVLQPGDEIPVTATMTAGLRQADKSTVKVDPPVCRACADDDRYRGLHLACGEGRAVGYSHALQGIRRPGVSNKAESSNSQVRTISRFESSSPAERIRCS